VRRWRRAARVELLTGLDFGRPVRQRLWFSVGTKEETDHRDGNGVIDAVQDTTELIDELELKGWKKGDNLCHVLVEGASTTKPPGPRFSRGSSNGRCPAAETGLLVRALPHCGHTFHSLTPLAGPVAGGVAHAV